MKYALHVVRGRAGNSTIKLLDGVNSIGRHDDCQIRIRSSQVSRRHCELVEDGQSMLLRDLGSSNGTFVNGKRVLGQQRLKPGDVITVGGVALRLDQLGATPAPAASAPEQKVKASDTAELQALPEIDLADDLQPMEEEFDVPLEEVVEDPDQIGLIPLDDDDSPAPPPARPSKPAAAKPSAKKSPEPEPEATSTKRSADEEAAVAQFLMDLKLDEED